MGALLVLVFVVGPLVELYVIVQVGQSIGVLPTIALLLGVSILGGWLVKREGIKAWRAFVTATQQHRVPAREVADGALILFAGALLLTPGFVTDALGLFLLLPPTRALVRKAFVGAVASRFVVVDVAREAYRRRPGRVVDGEVEGEKVTDPRAPGGLERADRPDSTV